MFISMALVFLVSCSKYEDGPAISLRSKKARLSNEWQVSSAYQNGADRTSDFNAAFAGYLLKIEKEGNYTLTYSPFSLGTVTESGTWKFNSDETHVIFTDSDGNQEDYKILRLKEKELWVEFTDDDGNLWEVRLVPKA
jgi:hypothetical protein